ncbi:ribosome hibernation promotion factor [Nocardia pseudobrasiliensis]|uniref:ribosome hibernation promotion factor n=1 Tax=Nocardia pseudobrasiliensis TaxID=45979 RepID=UPI001FE9ED21|nr:sigma 54 modulation/S30EA ribosomal C-terminal domain-containing protein [Nocardia pseudobrasiliensis]
MQISIGHHVSAGGAEYAREKITHALGYASEPVLSARVRLTGHRDPAMEKPIVAQANVNFDGRGVRVQVAAATTREAIDLLEARLKARLERLSRHWEAVRGAGPGPGPHEWRHGETPRVPLPYFPRPSEQREVVRHKSFALADETCDEAAFDMETMDYGFHLFTESGSRTDSVLYRTDIGYRLAQLVPQPHMIVQGAVPVSVSPAPAPELDVEDAIARLEVTGWPFVFFRDRERKRGCVLYHRYDGHYGLITPSAT